jgi:hypothetical protein
MPAVRSSTPAPSRERNGKDRKISFLPADVRVYPLGVNPTSALKSNFLSVISYWARDETMVFGAALANASERHPATWAVVGKDRGWYCDV